jgi:tripartite-type tricarboxylate transporter receptor subunit TctC
MERRRFLHLAASAAALPVASRTAWAQAYPSRAIKLVSAFGPGGPTDVTARLVVQALQKSFSQSVVVEYRAGAAGATGTKAAAGAEPDGYTLLIGTSATLAVLPAVTKNPGFDPERSFTAIARIGDTCNVLVVPPSFPAGSVREFVAYGKAHPGRLTYASAGIGNQTHLVAEMLMHDGRFDALHVPYKSGAEMATAVLSGQVDFAFPDVSLSVALAGEGKLKALAVTSPARRAQLPDVPTMIESGLPDVVATFWGGVVAPAGTPPAIVEKLNAAINAGLRSPDITASVAKIGVELSPGSPQDFAAFIAAERRRWAAVAAATGISLD